MKVALRFLLLPVEVVQRLDKKFRQDFVRASAVAVGSENK